MFAQVTSRPTEPPIVTAESDQWYRLGEPIVSSGEFYYPAGPVAFPVYAEKGSERTLDLPADRSRTLCAVQASGLTHRAMEVTSALRSAAADRDR